MQLLLILFFEKRIKDLLSANSGIGLNAKLKSFPSLSSQILSTAAKEPAMSSASIVDRVTMFCFFDDQEMGDPLYV